jgi:hypothetical protein
MADNPSVQVSLSTLRQQRFVVPSIFQHALNLSRPAAIGPRAAAGMPPEADSVLLRKTPVLSDI